MRSFREFLDYYLNIWRESSLIDLKNIISSDYKAREISNGVVDDFGFTESILGWEQGFNYAIENKAKWDIQELAIIPLKDDEKMVILSATMIIDNKSLDSANIFFQTFKRNTDNNWKLVRSYIEAGISTSNIAEINFFK
ncbi:flavoprotein [Solibacillus sp. CAU 1738]|uniref:flavoprotein n=1 Tax=Solibacillus sp. CAU 1738 TaxID=3140363 RepID=UPI00326029E9